MMLGGSAYRPNPFWIVRNFKCMQTVERCQVHEGILDRAGIWTVESKRSPFQVGRTAQKIVGTALRDLDCVYADCLQRKMSFISTA